MTFVPAFAGQPLDRAARCAGSISFVPPPKQAIARDLLHGWLGEARV